MCLPAGQAGQLQCHVLGDMAEVGAARHRRQEPARPARRAVVLAQAGQRHGQPLGEAGEAGGLLAGELVELQPRDADGPATEYIGPAQTAQVFKPHVRSPRCWSLAL